MSFRTKINILISFKNNYRIKVKDRNHKIELVNYKGNQLITKNFMTIKLKKINFWR